MSTSSKDRTGLCTFTFDDGRHCNMPHTQNELRLCYFHEKRELQRLMARDAGLQISRFLATNLHTACDLNGSFAMLYRAGAQGLIESKMVNSLTRLGHLLVKTHLLAKEEYLSAYQTDWTDIVQQSVTLRPAPDPHLSRPNSKPAPPEPPQEKPTEEEAHVTKPSPQQIVEESPAQDRSDQPMEYEGCREDPGEIEELEEDDPENQQQDQSEELPEEAPVAAIPNDPTDDDPAPSGGISIHRRRHLQNRQLRRNHPIRPDHSDYSRPHLTTCRMTRSKSSRKQTAYARPQLPIESIQFPNHSAAGAPASLFEPGSCGRLSPPWVPPHAAFACGVHASCLLTPTPHVIPNGVREVRDPSSLFASCGHRMFSRWPL